MTNIDTDYCTAAQLKDRMGIPLANTDLDTQIALAITTSSREIDAWCDRPHNGGFFRTDPGTVRYIEVSGSYYELPVGDIIAATAVATDTGDGLYSQAWLTTDFSLRPLDAQYGAVVRPYTLIRAVGTRMFPLPYVGYGLERATVKITGTWGWPAIPSGVTDACLILAAESMKLGDAPFGVVGGGEFGVVRIRNNPKAIGLLQPFRKMPVKIGGR